MSNQTMTKSTSLEKVKRVWKHIDVDGKVLGRVATEIAQLLMGKSKPYFVRHLDCGDYVVVTNAAKIVVTGKKESKKMYHRHSMYPGGFRTDSFQDIMKKHPEDIIIHAVKGMLPQNKLRDKMLKRLFVFAGSEHKYNDKFTN